MTDKQEVRKRIKAAIRQLSDTEKRAAAEKICAVLLADKRLAQCKNIVAYWSLPDEVPTPDIIGTFMAAGHTVFLPAIAGNELEIRMFEGEQSLKAEPQFGIGEPQSAAQLPDDSDTAIIVPGVAFATNGARLGRGKGFYDRLLSKHAEAYKIGIGFECQRTDTLPTEPHDVPMDRVVFA